MGRVVHYYRINEHDRRMAATGKEFHKNKIELSFFAQRQENARLCVTQKADLTKPQG